MASLSIDLGTYNLCAVIDDKYDSIVVQDCDGSPVIPSCIEYNDDGSVKYVGKKALRNTWKKKNVVRCAKRIIGMNMNSTDMHFFMDKCLAPVVPGEHNFAAFQLPCFPDRTLTPTKVCSDLIRYIGSIAIKQRGPTIKELIITVPAFFTQIQRLEIKKAAVQADICNSVHLVSEPVAAAYNYGLNNEDNVKNFMVVDFGAGTLDICVMHVSDDQYTVKASGGDRQLGGEDLTDALCDQILILFEEEYKERLIQYSKQNTVYYRKWEALKKLVEEAKISLSTEEQYTLNFGGIRFIHNYKFTDSDDSDDSSDSDREYELTLTRDTMNIILKPFMDRAEDKILEILRINNIDADELDSIILVGGSSKLLTFQERLHSMFGDRVHVDANPDECVARGAYSVLSNSIINNKKPLIDILPHAYGTVCLGVTNKDEFSYIIPRGSPFPSNKVYSRVFYQPQHVDGSYIDYAEVGVYISEDGNKNHYQLLTPFQLEHLSTDPNNYIKIEYTMTPDGILMVEVKENIDNHVVFEKQPLGQLIGFGE